MKKKIVWGSCWFNESIDTLINFFITSLKPLQDLGFEVTPIIFDAKYTHNEQETSYIKSKIDNIIILQNNTNIFPNKNYGVALITKKAQELETDYIAIVDCDWDLNESKAFVNNIFKTLLSKDYDLVIPSIGKASGRSNLLVGNTIITLFYPEYKDIIKTAFPGSLVAKTTSLYKIVTDENYHYDWGGEWDIISLGIMHKMNIASSNVNVTNVRHRSTTSKMHDSFQIWKAALTNPDIENRFNNLCSYTDNAKAYNDLTNKLLDKNNTIKDMINIIETNDRTDTESQLLYMILYPIAYLTNNLDKMPEILDSKKAPYIKDEINKIIPIALSITKNALLNNKVQKKYKFPCEFISDWTLENQEKAFQEYKEV